MTELNYNLQRWIQLSWVFQFKSRLFGLFKSWELAVYSVKIEKFNTTIPFCHWEMSISFHVSLCNRFHLVPGPEHGRPLHDPWPLKTYSPFLGRGCPFSLLLFPPFWRFNFEKIKTSVPSPCYWTLRNALQTFSCNLLRYWDWSGEAEPESMDRIPFQSTNLLIRSTHPNPLLSQDFQAK
jgi:hypothetical protein